MQVVLFPYRLPSMYTPICVLSPRRDALPTIPVISRVFAVILDAGATTISGKRGSLYRKRDDDGGGALLTAKTPRLPDALKPKNQTLREL